MKQMLHNVRLLTITSRQLLVTEDALIVWQDGSIEFAGARADYPPQDVQTSQVERIDGGNKLAAPAFIDCHTHLIFAGHRAEEFQQRLAGVSYQEIAAAGGGIASTVRQTQNASVAELVAAATPRAKALLQDGVATIEIKSGYGLNKAAEQNMLIAATELAQQLGFAVQRTYLGLHALPTDIDKHDSASRLAWIKNIADHDLPALHAAGLVDAVDAFVEGIAFSAAESKIFFDAATNLGLKVKLHADQLSNTHGAALAASYQALSADHVEYTDEAGAMAMAQAGTVAVLLPTAFYCLRETKLPPIPWFRQHGVRMAVATDCNPGTSPAMSLRLAMHQACTLFGLTIPEVFQAVTAHAAAALGLTDRGELSAGQRADIALWDVQSPAEIVYWMGALPVAGLWVGGRRAKT
jgi:imidazolonepropionase